MEIRIPFLRWTGGPRLRGLFLIHLLYRKAGLEKVVPVDGRFCRTGSQHGF